MLKIVMLDAPGVLEGKALMLVDADGAPLPMQMATTLHQETGEAGTFTVTFRIDGSSIVLG